MGYEFARVHSHLDHVHQEIDRLRDEVDNLKYVHEQRQRGRPRTRAQAWTDGTATGEEQGLQVEEIFDSEGSGNDYAQARSWGYGSGYGGNNKEQYDNEIRQDWNGVQDNLHYGSGSNAGAEGHRGVSTGDHHNQGGNTGNNNGGWNASRRFGNDGAGDDWDGERKSVAPGSVKNIKESDGWGFTDIAVEKVHQKENSEDLHSQKSVIVENAGDAWGNDKQDSDKNDDWNAESVKDDKNDNVSFKEDSVAPSTTRTISNIDENVAASAVIEKTDSVQHGDPVTKNVDIKALQGDLTYAIGECAGMLKTFGRIVAQPGGVDGTPFDRAGRDLYRALRELEGTMEAIRRAKRHGN